MSKKHILVSEVGPRDGLQSIKTIMPTEAKKRWIKAMADCGIKEIEVGSFVPASLFPQLADTAEIVRYAIAIEGLQVAALVPNFKGAVAAIEAGVHKLSIPFSVSETHCLKNLRRNHQEVIQEVAKISQYIAQLPVAQRPHFETSLSTAFGCTLEGVVAESKVLSSAEKLIEAGADEVGLSDTTGYANPAQVTRLVNGIKSCVGNDKLTGVHLHNTRGLGLANALAAIEAGIETIDSSMGGLGGCPFAPGASGNIVTEDLVFMLQAMGFETGIDLPKLLLVRDILKQALPAEPLYGFTPDAGLPKGFVGSQGS
ncbi:hydroxymethylglutaryl-CoA lyase [Paraglaciecola sp. 2405UD69-4]|uniref:hydroxymethylglutaryl-CoA lyase n=1 Tax=Paraglaciecola sp. 2405UD69-4 TaxID=3391836 RepID=UPI0039C98043